MKGIATATHRWLMVFHKFILPLGVENLEGSEMKKDKIPTELAIDLSGRSACNVQVAAVIVDTDGRIVSWGWNHEGSGLGECAEAFAIKRANRKRLVGASIYVFGRWAKSGNWVTAIPCSRCMALIHKHDLHNIWHSGKDGQWHHLTP